LGPNRYCQVGHDDDRNEYSGEHLLPAVPVVSGVQVSDHFSAQTNRGCVIATKVIRRK